MTPPDHGAVVDVLRRELHGVNDDIPLDLPSDRPLDRDAGVDSLDLVEFVACVEYRYGFVVPDDEWHRLRTLDEIAAYVVANAPA